ncbi:hypothetical protein [Actinoplanes aureus]|uniref:Uncharacterized protein n=1 Tax=Actinoplanes aureus TaxID=2792083 RepID=A0A931CJ36_9ACTN|nr:hypothetical protein [Actinoplanes aureus]MBG0565840.1 hypothetical protein [Actinoplanes aureus]
MGTVTRRLALLRADLDDAVCPVPEEIARGLGDRESVTVVLEHRAYGGTATRSSFEAAVRRDAGRHLHGIDWPADLHPGVLVGIAWRPAKDEIGLRTVSVEDPVSVDGIGYFHEYDPTVVTREFEPGKSNHGQVLGVVRRLGRVFDDGSAVSTEAAVAARCGLGRGARGAFLFRNAVDQLIREGYVTRVPGSVGADGQPSYPAVDGEEPAEMLFYAPLVEPIPMGDGADRREHWVNGFIRKLPPGAQPSPKQLAAYRRAVENEQIDEDTLAPGYTFVKKHHRHG